MTEQSLVLEGKGTRDWTVEQQDQIAERGKAYDDQGRTFEGQHMKSVSLYPDYQGDPRNIQFLSREEHLAAHGGNWMNPTNGYYDPVLKTMSDFGDGVPLPCRQVRLTKPLHVDPLDAASAKTTGVNSQAGTPVPKAPAPTAIRGSRTQTLMRLAQQAWKDPRVRAAVVSVGFGAAKVAVDAALGDRAPRDGRIAGPSSPQSATLPPAPGTDSLRAARRPPDAHGVSGYIRKNGTHVAPYQRGGKKD